LTLPRRYCLRYLKVEVKALSRKFRLQFDEIALETVTSAGSPQPAVIADPQLKAIDDVAVRTLQNCMQEVFEMGRNATVGCGSATCACRRWSMT
jgi:diaminopimelate epimerase